MNDMNISIISPQIYPCKTGGVEIFNYYLIKELAAQGHKIWVFTYCNYNWNNRNIHCVNLWRRFLGSSMLSVNFSIFIKLIQLKNKIDVVHVPYTSNSPLVYSMLLAKKLTNIAYIITIHGGGMYSWKPETPQQLSFEHAGAIIGTSEIIKKEYEKRSGRKVIYIPNSLPFEKSKESKYRLRKMYHFSEEDTIILSFGTIKKIKGVDILLESFLQLGKNFIEKNHLKLLFVGTGPMKSKLEQIVKEKGFEKSILFFGHISEENKPKIYKLSDIYIIPSLFEGLPLSLLEAMYNGLPVIGTDTTGINQLIKDYKTGLLFPKGNSDILKKKIKLLIENKDLMNELAENEKKMIRSFYNYDDMIEKYLNIYKLAIIKG